MTLKCKSICPKPNLTWHEVDHCPLALSDIPSKVYLREQTVLLRQRVQSYIVGGSYHRDNEDARSHLCRLRFAGARSVIPGEHEYAVSSAPPSRLGMLTARSLRNMLHCLRIALT